MGQQYGCSIGDHRCREHRKYKHMSPCPWGSSMDAALVTTEIRTIENTNASLHFHEAETEQHGSDTVEFCYCPRAVNNCQATASWNIPIGVEFCYCPRAVKGCPATASWNIPIGLEFCYCPWAVDSCPATTSWNIPIGVKFCYCPWAVDSCPATASWYILIGVEFCYCPQAVDRCPDTASCNIVHRL